MNRFVLLIAVMLTPWSLALKAQHDLSSYYTHIDFDSTKTDQLLLQIESFNFFKNNEYFSDYIKGYTLPGFSLEPSLIYYPSSKFRLKAGLHFQQFHGSEHHERILPVIAAQLMLTNNLSLTVGALKGHVHHNMPEPIFDPEWQINRPVETGIQFLYNTSRITADLWLDWRQYIRQNDTIPEKFTVGLNSRFMVSPTDADWNFSIPFLMTATHRGGQISDFDEPMESLLNAATGLIAEKNIDRKHLKKIGFSLHGFFYKDLTDKKERPFNTGYAIYPTVSLHNTWGNIMGGWWHASDFYSPLGNPEFMSTSTFDANFYRKERNMVTLKYNFGRELAKKIRLNAGVETYYDTHSGDLEYFYAVSLIYTPSFKIATITSL